MNTNSTPSIGSQNPGNIPLTTQPPPTKYNYALVLSDFLISKIHCTESPSSASIYPSFFPLNKALYLQWTVSWTGQDLAAWNGLSRAQYLLPESQGVGREIPTTVRRARWPSRYQPARKAPESGYTGMCNTPGPQAKNTLRRSMELIW